MYDAFEDLTEAMSPQDSKDFDSATLQRVQQEALNLETKLNPQRLLRGRLEPLFVALEMFSHVVQRNSTLAMDMGPDWPNLANRF